MLDLNVFTFTTPLVTLTATSLCIQVHCIYVALATLHLFNVTHRFAHLAKLCHIYFYEFAISFVQTNRSFGIYGLTGVPFPIGKYLVAINQVGVIGLFVFHVPLGDFFKSQHIIAPVNDVWVGV